MLAGKFGYEIGVFNGTGAAVNTATKTLSDDWHIPSLLYAGRFTYMPKGVMPATQGNPNRLNEDKIMLGVSTSINVESESESTNDFRAGLEFAMLKNKWYLGADESADYPFDAGAGFTLVEHSCLSDYDVVCATGFYDAERRAGFVSSPGRL